MGCRAEDVRAKFERYGPIRDVYLPKDYCECIAASAAAAAQRSLHAKTEQLAASGCWLVLRLFFGQMTGSDGSG
jgi:hypothetical protein